jgi:hypothetical protein
MGGIMEEIDDDINLEEHDMVLINYRDTNNKVEIDKEILPVVIDFWNHGINTFECCQGQPEAEALEFEDLYPISYPWIICDATNQEYIENTYNVNIHKNNHFGYYVYEYVEGFMNIDTEQDFLFVVFKNLERKKT